MRAHSRVNTLDAYEKWRLFYIIYFYIFGVRKCVVKKNGSDKWNENWNKT